MSATELDNALRRLQQKYPPKHPDRKAMREYERRVTNTQPVVHDTNGWSPTSTVARSVDWKKQERIPVGKPNAQPAGPSPRVHVSAGKGRGNKGPKNSGR